MANEPAPRVRGFPPVVGERPRVLVLGSMPGVASLDAQAYYAHPRNAFWWLLGELLGLDSAAPFAERYRAAGAAGIALWDVLAECVRPGSLDARIRRDSAVINPIGELLRAQPTIRAVALNGRTAEALFRRHVLPGLIDPVPELLTLPSTSPAHAARSRAQKLAAWRVLMRFL